MGGQKIQYRVTFLGVDDSIEAYVYSLESRSVALGEEIPKELPYTSVIEKGTLNDLRADMYPEVYWKLKNQILTLTKLSPTVVSDSYSHHMAV